MCLIIKLDTSKKLKYCKMNYQQLLEAIDNFHESKKLSYKIYETATGEPHSFLCINRLEKNPDKMFMKNFSQFLKMTYYNN